MSFFGNFVAQLFAKSDDHYLKNGDHILVEFGRAKTPVYVFYQHIPMTAKLLVNLNKLPPLNRRVALPGVAKFMWDNYLQWTGDIREAAYTYTWGQIFLLAHTTKVLQDETGHWKSLQALLTKGEAVDYQIEGMFSVSDWKLVHDTVKAGETQDDATRDTIRELFHKCPLLFNHMIVERGVTSQELHDIGLEYADTYEAKYVQLEDGLSYLDPISVFGRPRRSISGLSLAADPNVNAFPTAEAAEYAGAQLVQDNNEFDVNRTAVVPTDEQVVDPREAAGVLKDEDMESQDGDLSGYWDVVSFRSLNSHDSDSNEEELQDGEPAAPNMPSHPGEDPANQLADLVVVEEDGAVGNTEEHAPPQGDASLSDEGGVVLHREGSSVAQELGGVVFEVTNIPQGTAQDADDVIGSAVNQSEEAFVDAPNELQHPPSGLLLPVDLPQAVPEARLNDSHVYNAEYASEPEDAPGTDEAGDAPDAKAADYTAGFVPTHDLPRTAPGSPKGKYSFEERRKGQKRSASDVDDVIWASGAKHVRHEGERWPGAEPEIKEPREVTRRIKEPTKKYGKSALHALREGQAAFKTAPKDTTQREDPTRQPKGPPALGKEMADDKAKDPEAWLENFAVGTPPRPTKRPEKRMTFSLEKGVNFVDRDD